MVLEAGTPGIEASADLALGLNLLLGSQMAVLLCPHVAERKRGSKWAGVSSCKATNAMERALPP